MVQDLLAAKRDLKLSGLFKRLSRYEVPVLDDLGYVQPPLSRCIECGITRLHQGSYA
mgnify:CR=1 FL=1